MRSTTGYACIRIFRKRRCLLVPPKTEKKAPQKDQQLFQVKAIWLESVCRPSMFSLESELKSEAEEQGRIQKTDWCQSSECKPVAT